MNTFKSVIYRADDDAADRYFIRWALQNADPALTIMEAEDGSDLLTMPDSWTREPTPQPVSLILLDTNMPKSNGLETLLALKENPALRHIPTVMISTSALPAQVAAAYQHGVNSYIQNPPPHLI